MTPTLTARRLVLAVVVGVLVDRVLRTRRVLQTYKGTGATDQGCTLKGDMRGNEDLALGNIISVF